MTASASRGSSNSEMTKRFPRCHLVFYLYLEKFLHPTSRQADVRMSSERISVRGFSTENTGETVLESSTATYNVRREISAQVAPGYWCLSRLRKNSFS